MRFLLAAILALTATGASAQSDDEVYTLYRSSVLDPSMRLHVATFDSTDGKDYNAENCNLAADLFQRQDGVQTRFWCESGRYHK
jgi:hypothetical protein